MKLVKVELGRLKGLAEKAYQSESGLPQRLDKNTLDRVTVNYIRHKLTNYDYATSRIKDKSRYWAAYKTVMSAIASTYPELKREVVRQVAVKYNNEFQGAQS